MLAATQYLKAVSENVVEGRLPGDMLADMGVSRQWRCLPDVAAQSAAALRSEIVMLPSQWVGMSKDRDRYAKLQTVNQAVSSKSGPTFNTVTIASSIKTGTLVSGTYTVAHDVAVTGSATLGTTSATSATATNLTVADGATITAGHTSGMRIGSSSSVIGFFGALPIPRGSAINANSGSTTAISLNWSPSPAYTVDLESLGAAKEDNDFATIAYTLYLLRYDVLQQQSFLTSLITQLHNLGCF